MRFPHGAALIRRLTTHSWPQAAQGSMIGGCRHSRGIRRRAASCAAAAFLCRPSTVPLGSRPGSQMAFSVPAHRHERRLPNAVQTSILVRSLQSPQTVPSSQRHGFRH